MPLTTNYANKVLNYIFGKETLSKPEAIYIALSTNDPEADNGLFEELSGNTYERVPAAGYIGDAADRSISNTK
jgi:hypothetical protein